MLLRMDASCCGNGIVLRTVHAARVAAAVIAVAAVCVMRTVRRIVVLVVAIGGCNGGGSSGGSRCSSIGTVIVMVMMMVMLRFAVELRRLMEWNGRRQIFNRFCVLYKKKNVSFQ